ncbi:MAG: hypothetical protein ACI81S_002191, partial [Sphingobacteriales bacterium]
TIRAISFAKLSFYAAYTGSTIVLPIFKTTFSFSKVYYPTILGLKNNSSGGDKV